jgi:hypothetical protein
MPRTKRTLVQDQRSLLVIERIGLAIERVERRGDIVEQRRVRVLIGSRAHERTLGVSRPTERFLRRT